MLVAHLSRRQRRRVAWLGLACLFAVMMGRVEAASANKVTFDDQVLPILRNQCLNCHNSDKKKADLDLSNYNGIRAGGGSGQAVLAGDSAGSLMWKLITHQQEPNMPPKGPKLPDAELAVIKQWIEGGLLENSGSKAVQSKKPKLDLAVTGVTVGRPEGPVPMPNGHLLLEPVARTPRAGAVTALAGSPWAPLVAVAGQRQVVLYHLDSLDIQGVLPFPEGFPYVLKFSRNGKLLLVGGGIGAKLGKVVLFDVTTGKRITELGDEFDSVLAADISPDHSQVALGGSSKIIRVFSTATGELQHTFKKHTDWITALAYSPDGVLLISGDRNGGVHVWESAAGQPYSELRAHQQAVTDIAWRDDSNLIATSSEDGQVMLWEPENSSRVRNWAAHNGGVASVRFTHDGRLVTAGRDRVAKLWDANGGQQRVFEGVGDIAMNVAVSDSMTRVMAGDFSGQVTLWNLADGKKVGQLNGNPPRLAERLESEAQAVKEAREGLTKAEAQSTAARERLAQVAAQLATTHTNATQANAARGASEQSLKGMEQAVIQSVARRDAAQKELATKVKELDASVVALKTARQTRDQAQMALKSAQVALASAESTQKAAADLAAQAKTATNAPPKAAATTVPVNTNEASVVDLKKTLMPLSEASTAAEKAFATAESAESRVRTAWTMAQKSVTDAQGSVVSAEASVAKAKTETKGLQEAAEAAAKALASAEQQSKAATDANGRAQAEQTLWAGRLSEAQRRMVRWKAAEVNVRVWAAAQERDKLAVLAAASQAKADQLKSDVDKVSGAMTNLRNAIVEAPAGVTNAVLATVQATNVLELARKAVPQLANTLVLRVTDATARSNALVAASAAVSIVQGRLKAVEEGRGAAESTRLAASNAVQRARVAVELNPGAGALTNALVKALQAVQEINAAHEALRQAEREVGVQLQAATEAQTTARTSSTAATDAAASARRAVDLQPGVIQTAEKGVVAANEALAKARAALVELPKQQIAKEAELNRLSQLARSAAEEATALATQLTQLRQRHDQILAEYQTALVQR
jgi:hypothetical protein